MARGRRTEQSRRLLSVPLPGPLFLLRFSLVVARPPQPRGRERSSPAVEPAGRSSAAWLGSAAALLEGGGVHSRDHCAPPPPEGAV